MVQARKHVLLILGPLLLLRVVLIAQATGRGAAARVLLRDVDPFHAAAAQLDQQLLLLISPLALQLLLLL